MAINRTINLTILSKFHCAAIYQAIYAGEVAAHSSFLRPMTHLIVRMFPTNRAISRASFVVRHKQGRDEFDPYALPVRHFDRVILGNLV